MSSRSPIRCLIACVAAALLVSPGLALGAPSYVPGQIIVKYKSTAQGAQKSALLSTLNAQRLRSFSFIGAELLKVEGLSVERAVALAKLDPSVAYAEPDYIQHVLTTPNDPRYPEMWQLHNTGQDGGTPGADIKADLAWNTYTGNPNVMVGIIDTGVAFDHPDLAANCWTNPGEIPANNIDDDGNGYVDDVHGYNFVANNGNPFDDFGHGSHCAGTIAGIGNNGVGITGINWQAKVVGIKFLDSSGSGSTSGAISSVQYAIAIGCQLTSNSWGGGGFSQALLDAINAAGAAGQLFVAAAGNSGQDTDALPSYPASYDTPYVVAVAATDRDDHIASFSNFGLTTVDLGAPGVNTLSTVPTGSCSLCDPTGYALLSGTSMATPHVSGVCALLWGRFPAMTNLQVKNRIMMFADPIPALTGKCVTGARLNAFMAIADPDTIPPGQVTDLATTTPGSTTMGLAWTATGDDGGTGRATTYDLRYSTAPIDSANFGSATQVTGEPDPQTAGSAESFEVSGLDFSTLYYFAVQALDEFNNAGPISNVPSGTTLGIPNIDTAPGSLSTTLLTGATEDQTLTVSNTGEGTLDFTVPKPELLFKPGATYDGVVMAKGAVDTRKGEPVIMGKGGPDSFGYRWVDSDEPGGPAFSWVDITGVGTLQPLVGDDANSGLLPMGMSFPFYGNTFSDVRVCTNGWLSFTDAGTAYSNNQLPGSTGPANLVAPFWDDLDFGTGTQRMYTYNDGTRFIVEYVGVPHYSTGGPYTFEVILYPTGEIRYQYLTMADPVNSATIGIQNATKTVGLQVAFNTAYLHDNLLVRIFPLSQWLTVSPASGRVAAGNSMDLAVHFDAAGLQGGIYNANVRVLSNDPDGSPDVTAAQLHVIGAPNIAAAPDTTKFGQIFVGASPTHNLIVSNNGTDVLNVTNITSDDGTLTVGPTAFTLNPAQAQAVVLTYHPLAPGVLNATLTISSDDPDEPTKYAYATGSAVPAPSFSVTPTSFDETLNTNQAVSRNLRIDNNGGSNYVFTAQTILNGGASVQVHTDAENVPLAKGEADKVSGPKAEASGGPDTFGYTFKDSDAPGGPTFNWVDVSGTGTLIPLNGDDQNLGTFPVGFNFPFYGATFPSFRICSNGFVSFTSTVTTFTNTALPNNGSSVPENLLAVFWDDMDFRPASGNAHAYYYYDGTRTVIQFKDVPHYQDNTHLNNFELIVYPDGHIVYQYLTMTATALNSCTIGTQNAAKDDGLQVVFNAAYMHDNLAVLISPPARFLTVTPPGGTVPAGGHLDLTVGFNSGGLFGGTYNGAVQLNGNDPIVPQLSVPAVLHVIGVPDIVNAPAALDYGDVFIGFPSIRQFQVQNTGTDDLSVNEIVSDDPAYTPDATNFTVPPLSIHTVNVTFSPTDAKPYPATLKVKSNDPDQAVATVALDGVGLVAPNIESGASALGAGLSPNSSTTRTLTLSNTGGSPLTYSIGPSVSAASAMPTYPTLNLGKTENDPRPGIMGSGGPDTFGYRWKDSDDPGGPVFGWVDITGVGTSVGLNGDDQNVAGIPIGFNFSFYGSSFNTVNACTNGWLSFTSTATAYSNQALPSAGSPENLLAPFWDDMDFRTSGSAYYYNDGSRFIVEYVAAPHYSAGGPYTFEVILYPNGKIVYQYLDMGSPLDSSTIGIQDATNTVALQVVFNAAYMHNNLAILISRTPDWLSADSLSGSIPAGDHADITVGFNSAGLEGGVYHGNLHIGSNDPDQGTMDIPVTLAVSSPTDLEAERPKSFGLTLASHNPAHGSANLLMAMPTRGQADVKVYDVRGTLVRTLSRDVKSPGFYPIVWDGRNQGGQRVASGLYFVRMNAGTFQRTVRVTLMR